jgi:hypothetical protein
MRKLREENDTRQGRRLRKKIKWGEEKVERSISKSIEASIGPRKPGHPISKDGF